MRTDYERGRSTGTFVGTFAGMLIGVGTTLFGMGHTLQDKVDAARKDATEDARPVFARLYDLEYDNKPDVIEILPAVGTEPTYLRLSATGKTAIEPNPAELFHYKQLLEAKR